MIAGIPVDKLSAPVLVAIAILMIFNGALVPKRYYNEKKAEAERWQLAAEISEKARAESEKQNIEMLELARTSHALIVAVFENSKIPRQSGGQNVAP